MYAIAGNKHHEDILMQEWKKTCLTDWAVFVEMLRTQLYPIAVEKNCGGEWLEWNPWEISADSRLGANCLNNLEEKFKEYLQRFTLGIAWECHIKRRLVTTNLPEEKTRKITVCRAQNNTHLVAIGSLNCPHMSENGQIPPNGGSGHFTTGTLWQTNCKSHALNSSKKYPKCSIIMQILVPL